MKSVEPGRRSAVRSSDKISQKWAHSLVWIRYQPSKLRIEGSNPSGPTLLSC